VNIAKDGGVDGLRFLCFLASWRPLRGQGELAGSRDLCGASSSSPLQSSWFFFTLTIRFVLFSKTMEHEKASAGSWSGGAICFLASWQVRGICAARHLLLLSKAHGSSSTSTIRFLLLSKTTEHEKAPAGSWSGGAFVESVFSMAG